MMHGPIRISTIVVVCRVSPVLGVVYVQLRAWSVNVLQKLSRNPAVVCTDPNMRMPNRKLSVLPVLMDRGRCHL